MPQTAHMPGKGKFFLAAVAIALLAAGCGKSAAPTSSTNTEPEQTQTTGQAPQPSPTPPQTTAGAKTNASLNSDLDNLDAQMKAADSDSAGIDSSLNEQQAP